MERKKGRLELSEAIEFLDNTSPKGPIGPLPEATYSRGYPDDGTGISGDDDRPPGNIVYGERYKKEKYFNKLTNYFETWGVDLGNWTWDDFEHSQGMEDLDNYSNTLQSMRDLFPDQTWDTVWKRMKHVPDKLTTLRFKQAGQPWRRGGQDQLGVDKETYTDVDFDKDGSFKDSTVKNESLVKKIEDIIQ
jgi:hypothetical protein